ncbi:hypothetical protein WB44_12080 [Synechococcus sp. WH 8020]|nr:hypothetical protein WB44_12080 [Synechococcus sp. WH 8020]
MKFMNLIFLIQMLFHLIHRFVLICFLGIFIVMIFIELNLYLNHSSGLSYLERFAPACALMTFVLFLILLFPVVNLSRLPLRDLFLLIY